MLAASDEDPPEDKNNLMLHKAIRALFARAPLFHTQTLNLAAHPVPETCCCCTENNAEGTATALEHTDAAGDQESLSLLSSCRTKPQKRLRGADLVRERKRRKSSSWREYCTLYIVIMYINWLCLLLKVQKTGFKITENSQDVLLSYCTENVQVYSMFVNLVWKCILS